MKRLILLIPLIALFTSCQSDPKSKHPDLVLINGKVNCIGRVNYADVSKTLGKLTRINHNEAQCGTYFNADDSLADYHGVVFEKNQDTMAFTHMSFSYGSSDFVQFGRLKLTNETTIEDVKRLFILPNDRDTALTDYQGIGKVRMIDIEVFDQTTDERWYLIFQQGKLIRFELWIDC